MPYRKTLRGGGGLVYSAVSNTGYRHQVLFRATADFDYFITLLKRTTARYPTVHLLGFCLLEQSYRLLLQEDERGDIAKYMHSLGLSYGIYFNSRYKKNGKVFAGPYKDSRLETDDAVLHYLVSLHKEPVTASQPLRYYAWSSYHHYVKKTAPWIDKSFVTRYFATTSYVNELQRVTAADILP